MRQSIGLMNEFTENDDYMNFVENGRFLFVLL